jgi:hypothetical protein
MTAAANNSSPKAPSAHLHALRANAACRPRRTA